jgi:hypothetical protein
MRWHTANNRRKRKNRHALDDVGLYYRTPSTMSFADAGYLYALYLNGEIGDRYLRIEPVGEPIESDDDCYFRKEAGSLVSPIASRDGAEGEG